MMNKTFIVEWYINECIWFVINHARSLTDWVCSFGSVDLMIDANVVTEQHNGVQHGECGSSGHPHGRVYRGSTVADVNEPRVQHAAYDGHQSGASPGRCRRVQHPVRAQPALAGVLHHRSQRTTLPQLGPGQQSYRISSGLHRRQGSSIRNRFIPFDLH